MDDTVGAEWELSESDPPAGAVERITFVLFLADGACAMIRSDTSALSGRPNSIST